MSITLSIIVFGILETQILFLQAIQILIGLVMRMIKNARRAATFMLALIWLHG
jgi:hypothetical protein